MTHDILLQVAQVFTVLALAPVLQGVILQWEELLHREGGRRERTAHLLALALPRNGSIIGTRAAMSRAIRPNG